MRGLGFPRQSLQLLAPLSRVLAVMGMMIVLSACGDEPATQDFYVEPSIPENPIAQTQAAAAEVANREVLPASSPILPLESSGTTGELTITRSNGQVELHIRLQGLAGSLEFAAHVHRGVCAEGGPVAVALNSVVDGGDEGGTSTTELATDALPITEPLFVQIHGSSGAPIACGDIVES